MADFTTVVTDAGVIDADEVTVFEEGVIFGATPELVADQVATVRSAARAKTIQFAKYTNLAAATSALTDGEDITSTSMSDSTVTLVPAEYGNVITLARLADTESGGKASSAAGFLIGRNAGTTLDKLAITALEAATTNVIYPNGVSAVGSLTANDVLDKVFANRLFNKLARTNVPGINGMYVGIAHDDCLHDLRVDTANGGWIDVSKYADPSSALRNEVGMFAGIRWLRSSNVTITSDGGVGTVDSYEVQVVGFNALGRGDASALELKITGPFDKLGRYLNYGWYWLGKYGMIDENNAVSGVCASTVGAN